MLPSSFRCCAVFEWPDCLRRLSGARVRPRAGLLQDWTESFMIYEEARRHLVSSVLVWLTALSILLVAAYIAAAKARNVAKYAAPLRHGVQHSGAAAAAPRRPTENGRPKPAAPILLGGAAAHCSMPLG